MTKNTKRYTVKMEQMILKAYADAPNNQTNVATATQLQKDFQRIFSYQASSKLTPNGIAQKYYTLCQRNVEVKPKVNSMVTQKVIQKPKSTLRDNIFKAIKDSEDMTITIKGSEITVVFK
jgi:hypothetical protein